MPRWPGTAIPQVTSPYSCPVVAQLIPSRSDPDQSISPAWRPKQRLPLLNDFQVLEHTPPMGFDSRPQGSIPCLESVSSVACPSASHSWVARLSPRCFFSLVPASGLVNHSDPVLPEIIRLHSPIEASFSTANSKPLEGSGIELVSTGI